MVPKEGTETKEETKMMNLLINAYHANSAANEYWFGFILNHLVYVVTGMTFEELAPFFKTEKAAQSKGGFTKIRIKARVAECTALVERATLLGGEEILHDEKWNTGIKFEQIVTEQIAGQKWERDSVPFWVGPDIALDGRKIQVKFNGAELTNERTIRGHFPGYLA
jgi:hypothetical protein